MQIKGLDVSEFQGNVDWEKVKAAGYQFAMLRAGYGFNTIDPQFKRNASECNRIGLPIGVYWFCYALTPEIARQEADGCLKAISGYRLDYPVCYDIEQASVNYAAQNGVTFTPETVGKIVQNFCGRMEKTDILQCITATGISSKRTVFCHFLQDMHCGTLFITASWIIQTARCGNSQVREKSPEYPGTLIWTMFLLIILLL